MRGRRPAAAGVARGRRPRALPPSLTVAILLAALLLRIAVPQGWMPVRLADGWRIMLCPGSGAMPAPDGTAHAQMMAMPGMKPMPAGQHHDAAEHPCAFSALAMALAEPAVPVVPAPMALAATWLATIGRAVAIGRGLAAPPPPATGPPLTA